MWVSLDQESVGIEQAVKWTIMPEVTVENDGLNRAAARCDEEDVCRAGRI